MALKELLPKHQIDVLNERIGDKYLKMNVPTKAENLVEGEWTLTKEEKDLAIGLMFGVDSQAIAKKMKKFKPTQHFLEIFKLAKTIKSEIDLINPSILDIKILNSNVFLLISVNETKGTKYIKRDENGKPFLNENKKPLMVDKKEGELVFSHNTSNFNAFFETYIAAFKSKVTNPFIGKEFTEVLSYVSSNNFDVDLFSRFDLQLYISGKPEDILNMSISKYYDSCQNLYNGCRVGCLPSNIFDKNSKIAYLKFNTPFRDRSGNVVPFTSFSRCMIRNIKGKIYFDLVYPKFSINLRNFFHSLITKYTGMKNVFKDNERKEYYFTDIGLERPYFDSVLGIPIKYNPNGKNDKKILALAEYFKEDPEYILELVKNHYSTNQGDFLVFNNKEANKEVIKYITETMVYRQEVYKPYINDVQKFYIDNKKKLLKGYKGEITFDKIAKWADEKPEDKEKAKHNLSKHNLFRAIKPYLKPSFFEERTSKSSILPKRRRLADDEVEIVLGNGFFAYRKEKRRE